LQDTINLREFEGTADSSVPLSVTWSVAQMVLPVAECQDVVSKSGKTTGYLKRASNDALKEVFNKYASAQVGDERFMTPHDLIVDFLGLYDHENANKESISMLAGALDTTKDRLISFAEFSAFEGLLCVPDALHRTAFQLFDTMGTGTVGHEEFCEVISKTVLGNKLPFDFNSEFVKMYFGADNSKSISYPEFTQFLHDFHLEHAHQAFKARHDGSGLISALDFADIMMTTRCHLLTQPVRDNLVAAANAAQVSYPFFRAFNALLTDMELVKRIYLNATHGSRAQEVTKEEFLHSAQMMSQITPLEVDILFHLTELISQSGGRILYSDLEALTPEQSLRVITRKLMDIRAVESPAQRSTLTAVLESAYRFGLGAIAGAIGATAVYPIDLVKTRMQNQRVGSYIGELKYRNSFDCFKKVLRHEGFTGLYRGLAPQLVGVAPEKAIKLTVNDLARDLFRDKKGQLTFGQELVAGACAGGSQVMFTNPLEIVKIRLQTAGEIASQKSLGAIAVVKELGFRGLYKGASACFMRDIPFSAIYFPVYAHSKAYLADENGYNAPWTLLVAGAIGGVPAASLTTPADVIKTRLQVRAVGKQTTYNGINDAIAKISKEEGLRAFWKGAPARVFRSSPQFGVTLLAYEVLQRLFYVDFAGARPAGSEAQLPQTASDALSGHPDHIGGYRVARPMFRGIESKFGLFLPKFEPAKV